MMVYLGNYVFNDYVNYVNWRIVILVKIMFNIIVRGICLYMNYFGVLVLLLKFNECINLILY